MLLPEKIRVAIDILARYDMAPGKLVPRWYRFYLKLKPDDLISVVGTMSLTLRQASARLGKMNWW